MARHVAFTPDGRRLAAFGEMTWIVPTLDDHGRTVSERAPVACRRNHGPASHFTRSPSYRGARAAVFRTSSRATHAQPTATGADRPKQETQAPVMAMITITLPVPEKSLRRLSSRQLASDRQCATLRRDCDAHATPGCIPARSHRCQNCSRSAS